MRTQCSLFDTAVMTAPLQGPLEKRKVARHAPAVAQGLAFDERVALATVDRMTRLVSRRPVDGPSRSLDGRAAA
ncbi:MAG: hypothetical protein EHM78_11185 [Myxococcaceae bacterium]|nr:MAG: hypothetical protein EHM78_11185 [Myxococcaceae bacterium]